MNAALQAARDRVRLKSADEIAWMREAGWVVHQVLEALRRAAEPGVTTWELDRLAESLALQHRAVPAFKGYLGFPSSLCTSLNDEIAHGLPSRSRALRRGDLLKLDFAVRLRRVHADAAISVCVGEEGGAARALARVAREALARGIEQMIPGRRVSDIGAAVQVHAQSCGASVVRVFCGHGIGRALHEWPQVPNYRSGEVVDLTLEPGMVLAVEPLVNAGGCQAAWRGDRWTAVTADGALSAHAEHTVAVTDGGPRVLTGGADGEGAGGA